MHAGLMTLSLVLATGSPRDLEVALPRKVFVPMNHSARHVDVSVFIGERGPFLFQVDTCASAQACIDDDLARELGLEVVETGLNSDGQTTRRVDFVAVDELHLGEATFRNVRALVDDYSMVPTSTGEPLQGLLGFALFKDLLMTVDYPGERIVLSRGRLDPTANGVVPFINRGVPDVHLMIGKRRLTFGIDTGMDATLKLYESDVPYLALDGDAPIVGTARSVYSEVEIRGDYLSERVSLAGLDFDASFAVFSPNVGGMRRLVGYGLFGDCALTFDQARGLVRFERAQAEPFDPESGWRENWLGTFVSEEEGSKGRSLSFEETDDGLVVTFVDGVALRGIPAGETEIRFATNMATLHLENGEDGFRRVRVERGPDLIPRWTAVRR